VNLMVNTVNIRKGTLVLTVTNALISLTNPTPRALTISPMDKSVARAVAAAETLATLAAATKRVRRPNILVELEKVLQANSKGY